MLFCLLLILDAASVYGTIFTGTSGQHRINECDPNEDCVLIVEPPYSWLHATLNCPSDHSCTVRCTGNETLCEGLDIIAESSTTLNVTCNTATPGRFGGVCDSIRIVGINIKNLNVECNGKESCSGINVTAIISEDMASCRDNKITSQSGYNINCNGINTCEWGNILIRSSKDVYNNWNATACAMSQASISCNGRQSCYNLRHAVLAIHGDAHIICSGYEACTYTEFDYDPPLLAQNNLNLQCYSGSSCSVSISALAAHQVIVDCIVDLNEYEYKNGTYETGSGVCDLYITGPVFPFDNIFALDLNSITVTDVNKDAVTVNCNGFGCIAIGVRSVFGYADISIHDASWDQFVEWSNCGLGADGFSGDHNGDDQYNECLPDHPFMVRNFARIREADIIIEQEYSNSLICATDKDCYIYGALTTDSCYFNGFDFDKPYSYKTDCDSKIIKCSVDRNCTLFSGSGGLLDFMNSIVLAQDSRLLYVGYGGYIGSCIYAPNNGIAVMFANEWQYENATVYAANTETFIYKGFDKYGLKNAVLFLQNVSDARFECYEYSSDHICADSFIYITYPELDVTNTSKVIPYHRFCFDCLKRNEWETNDLCQNMTFYIDNGVGYQIECITQFDSIESQYFCYDNNGIAYPLQIKFGDEDVCGVHSFIDEIKGDISDVIIDTTEPADTAYMKEYHAFVWIMFSHVLFLIH